MSSEASDKIIKRIQQLLALANNNPNEHEAAVAMKRAHRLLAEYNLSLADLTEAERKAQDPYTRDQFRPATISDKIYARRISGSIARLYFCKMFTETIRQGARNHVFVGRTSNVAIAMMVAENVLGWLHAQAKMESMRVEDFERSSYVTNFMHGASGRIYERCEALIKEAEEGKTEKEGDGPKTNLPALRNTYLAETNNALAFIKQSGVTLSPNRGSAQGGRYTNSGYGEGKAAGDRVNLRPGVSGGGTTRGALK